MTVLLLLGDGIARYGGSGDLQMPDPVADGVGTVSNPSYTGSGSISVPTITLTSVTGVWTYLGSGAMVVSVPTALGSGALVAPPQPFAPKDLIARLYDRLPEAWVYDDDGTLLTWLTGVLGLAKDISDTIQRYGQGQLTDPMLTDEANLPWLTYLTGAKVPSWMSSDDVRLALADPNARQHGSRRRIASQVAAELGGSATVQVISHWRDSVSVVAIVTDPTETPMEGVVITTWDELEKIAPTWDDLELYSEDELHEQDHVRITVVDEWAAGQKPVGIRLAHIWNGVGESLFDPETSYQFGPGWT